MTPIHLIVNLAQESNVECAHTCIQTEHHMKNVALCTPCDFIHSSNIFLARKFAFVVVPVVPIVIVVSEYESVCGNKLASVNLES